MENVTVVTNFPFNAETVKVRHRYMRSRKNSKPTFLNYLEVGIYFMIMQGHILPKKL